MDLTWPINFWGGFAYSQKNLFWPSHILSRSSRLLLVGVPQFHRLCDGLAVSHLRFAHLGLHLELARQAIDDDLQVQLTSKVEELSWLTTGRTKENRQNGSK